MKSSAAGGVAPPGAEGGGGVPAADLFIHPGQVVASASSRVLATILGTCVAVCLYDVEARVGGLNHFLLPHGGGSGPTGARYGDVAVERLLREMLGLGASRQRLRAKLFGGMTARLATSVSNDIGTGNVAFARDWLAEQAIALVGEDVGGGRGRKLLFQSQGGTAWVKYL